MLQFLIKGDFFFVDSFLGQTEIEYVYGTPFLDRRALLE